MLITYNVENTFVFGPEGLRPDSQTAGPKEPRAGTILLTGRKLFTWEPSLIRRVGKNNY